MSIQFKTLIFIGLLAMALGFIIPKHKFDESLVEPKWEYEHPIPVEDDLILFRKARSPQDQVDVKVLQSKNNEKTASIDYNHPINNNWEAYAQASRDFKRNDNNVHAGLKYKF